MKGYRFCPSPYSPGAHGLRIFVLRFSLALFALAWATGAQAALITVGPDGTYSSIQAGIDAALNTDGGEVRVENLGCIPAKCFYYNENVNIAFAINSSLYISGGWNSTFSQQTGLSQVRGVSGTDSPIIAATVNGGGTVYISEFLLAGTGTSAGFHTHGLLVSASVDSTVNISDNTITGVFIHTSSGTSTGTAAPGGAGLAVRAADTATIEVNDNNILSNVAFGTDSQSTYGGGAWVAAVGSGQILFDRNTLTDNTSTNASGGGCRGGGLWAAALDTSRVQLLNNVYLGNSQFACTNGATGDAAEFDASNTAVIDIWDETWTNNNVPSDPGVYEVYMQADVSSQILAQNGLITHGTWGGLYANSIASGRIDISNYTIADNPVLGFRGIGSGTQLWNTVLWNDGTAAELSNLATLNTCLFGTNPLFANEASGDYHLTLGSPAIDTGSNTPSGDLRTTDLDGNPRPVNHIADMGAYEYQYPNDLIFKNGFEAQL